MNGVRMVVRTPWECNQLTVERIVSPAVLEVLSESIAHDEMVLGIYRDVALVEESVNIAAEEDPVGDLVDAFIGVRPNVRGLQHRKGVLGGNGAGAPVGSHHLRPENTLAAPGVYQDRRAETSGVLSRSVATAFAYP